MYIYLINSNLRPLNALWVGRELFFYNIAQGAGLTNAQNLYMLFGLGGELLVSLYPSKPAACRRSGCKTEI